MDNEQVAIKKHYNFLSLREQDLFSTIIRVKNDGWEIELVVPSLENNKLYNILLSKEKV